MRPDRALGRLAASALAALALVALALPAAAQDVPEYRLKSAFVFNFAAFTEWPADIGATLNLCIVGADPFGAEADGLAGKKVGERQFAVQRRAAGADLKGCQIVFIAQATADPVKRVLDAVRGQPVLTIADTPGAMHQGVALNMNLTQGRVTFEANLKAARAAKLDLSSRLLRLATEVQQ